MRQSNVKVNLNHIKREVLTDYFKYRDAFYKCFIINLVLYGQTVRPILPNSLIEDTGYHQLFVDITSGLIPIDRVLNDIAIPNAGHMLADLNIYTSNLFDHHHKDNQLNVYRMHFKPDGHLILENFHLPCKR